MQEDETILDEDIMWGLHWQLVDAKPVSSHKRKSKRAFFSISFQIFPLCFPVVTYLNNFHVVSSISGNSFCNCRSAHVHTHMNKEVKCFPKTG